MATNPAAEAARGGAGGRNILLVRTGITFALLASVFSVQLQEPELLLSEEFRFLYLAVVVSYGGLLFRFAAGGDALSSRGAVLQALVDVGFASLIVYATGLLDSIFTFMYVVVILLGSLELGMRGGVIWSVLSSAAYLLLLHLQTGGVVIPPGLEGLPPSPGEIVRPVIVSTVAFLLTGILSGLLGQDVRRVRLQVQAREDDLRKLELFSRCVVENISSGILATGTDGRVTMANGSACAILGMPSARIEGKALHELFPGRGAPHPEGTGRVRPEFLYLREDGTEVPLGSSSSPLRDPDGAVIGTVMVFQDLTPIRTMEERVRMADRLAALGELAAGFAHEVRNPLASLAGSSQLLQETASIPDDMRPLLDIIGRESRRLDSLISDFLAFSSPIRPDVTTEVDLSALAGEVAEAIRTGEGREKGVRVATAGEEGVLVLGSREQLSQVLWNLARNAVQATPGGKGVTLSVSRQERQGEIFGAVTVADQGAGIDPSVRGRIFSPFFTTKEGGTGLGLAITQRIVHGHQGFIEVASRGGEGASFTVLLPPATPEGGAAGKAAGEGSGA